ncbi:RNA helicase [Pelagibaculum spongiae]|uniref:RNA helicase n=2 Tax=Pelagibaculum spongiae TaxID=2080658 RepID=A0A2V1GUM5_9GAMM|nr:RNA helicase [Pelagibaculum spongiae]
MALEDLKFTDPTEVQEKAIPLAMDEVDLLISAETGSGKTLAFMLPMLQRMLDSTSKNTGTRGLVMAPTRELARQLYKYSQSLAKHTKVQIGLITGGDDFKYQASTFRKNPEIIIGTPGRLLEHVERASCDYSELEMLVLDEADRMLDMGLGEDVRKLVAVCNPERQTMLLSATLGPKIDAIAADILTNPERLQLNKITDEHQDITQQVVLADDPAHKQRLTDWLLANEKFERAIIFTNKRDQVSNLRDQLSRYRTRIGMLHGEMTQDNRNLVMQAFRTGQITVLVATDVAARGLDVGGVDLVINFDMARKADEYVHRIGRTGRAGRKGLAVSLIGPYEWNLCAAIQKYLKQRFDKRSIEGMEGTYTGPKKVKSNGKASKKVHKKKLAKAEAKKPVNKRKKPGRGPKAPKIDTGGGSKPLMRKKKTED